MMGGDEGVGQGPRRPQRGRPPRLADLGEHPGTGELVSKNPPLSTPVLAQVLTSFMSQCEVGEVVVSSHSLLQFPDRMVLLLTGLLNLPCAVPKLN